MIRVPMGFRVSLAGFLLGHAGGSFSGSVPFLHAWSPRSEHCYDIRSLQLGVFGYGFNIFPLSVLDNRR